jgi:Subtilase family
MRDSGGKGGIRSNALWGSGSRGDSRRNALWGSGHGKRGNALWGGRRGRGMLLAAITAVTLLVPLAAGAKDGRPAITDPSFVSPGLLEKGLLDPGRKLHVIVQSAAGTSDATNKIVGLSANVRRKLDLIGAIAIDITAGKLAALAKQPGLIITPDASVHLTGTMSSSQMWPYETGLARLWGTDASPAPQAPTIAIVDSGIEANRLDFDGGSRVVGEVTMTGLASNSPGDGRGHGTFVAGIAAGSAAGYAGAAPNARILSIDVMDDSGTARTSDVIAACEYIRANKGKYNIRVANFSLHSAAKNHFYHDPLDQAVEKLWFDGIFVVAAAGNYGSPTGPSGVLHAPGNEPLAPSISVPSSPSAMTPMHRGRPTGTRRTASRSRSSPPPAATWSDRCRRARRLLRRSPQAWSSPVTSSCRGRPSRRPSSPEPRHSCSLAIRTGRLIKSRAP